MNHGERVRLKLRNLQGGWYDYQHVVLVMLHELVHNDISPHNKAFFKLLTEITAGPYGIPLVHFSAQRESTCRGVSWLISVGSYDNTPQKVLRSS